MDTITFPNLGLTVQLSPSFSLFGTGITVHWYAIIILLGVILGFLYACRFAKKEHLDTEYLYDVLLWGLPSAIVAARIYYVGFNFSAYRDNLWDVFKIWEGGIAIYGAVIGAVISTYIYARVKKQNVLQLFDMGVFGLIIGQAVGRWGNFVNQEAFGTNTNSLFAMSGNVIRKKLERMQLEGMAVTSELGVHPTFLYESLWNLLGAFILGLFHKKKKHHGEVFWLYLSWYGLGRCFIEGLRTDSLKFFDLRISQWVGAVTFLFGILLFVRSRRRTVTEESKNKYNESSDDVIDITSNQELEQSKEGEPNKNGDHSK
ncbi:MAG: prolipoprotein diacylglyceryl transferase [Clostridia bacterium]|nr:prolipoprotein diacylglyceryl transferase [Clostridia bacterium]